VDTKYEIGQAWEMDFYDVSPTTPPHVEDVIVTNSRFVGKVTDMRETLMGKIQPWKGGPEKLYDGLLLFSNAGKCYVVRWNGIPNMSTGYWIPDKPLTRIHINDKINYRYENQVLDEYNLPYVGVADTIDFIPAGTLVRVSLARWWAPEGMNEERCYLQFSGWYL